MSDISPGIPSEISAGIVSDITSEFYPVFVERLHKNLLEKNIERIPEGISRQIPGE